MEHLRDLRCANHLTQQEVANHLGVDRTTYVKYETGSSEPNFETLIKLSNYFEVSVGYLLGQETKKMPTTMSELSAEEIEHLRLYRGATEDARRLAELALKSDKPQ